MAHFHGCCNSLFYEKDILHASSGIAPPQLFHEPLFLKKNLVDSSGIEFGLGVTTVLIHSLLYIIHAEFHLSSAVTSACLVGLPNSVTETFIFKVSFYFQNGAVAHVNSQLQQDKGMSVGNWICQLGFTHPPPPLQQLHLFLLRRVNYPCQYGHSPSYLFPSERKESQKTLMSLAVCNPVEYCVSLQECVPSVN